MEDVFFVPDAHNQPLSDPDLCPRLQESLVRQLTDSQDSLITPSRISF